MGEVLVPVTEYPTWELAERLQELVNDNRGLLLQRHIIGPIRRYGDTSRQSFGNIELLKRNHDNKNPLSYAVLEEPEGDEVVGLATVYPDLPLGRMRVPIPAGIPKHSRYGRYTGWTRVSYPYAKNNLQAWTHGYSENTDMLRPAPADVLTAAYQGLVKVVSCSYGRQRAWTIEPVASPEYVHESIGKSGLAKLATGWFEDNEDNKHAPPRSSLYAQTRYRWLSARGQLKELRTGKEGMYERWEQDNDDFGPYLGAYK